MPHKHKRKEQDKSTFDLPPSSRATPLPVFTKAGGLISKTLPRNPKSKPKSKKQDADDDTPRAFARLMQFQKTGKRPSGLDNGYSEKRSKKRKRTEEASDPGAAPQPSSASQPLQPKILPGERLSDFALRVDQALPLSMPRHTSTPVTSSSKISGVKERTTKHNLKLLKMQEAWRDEERRRKEKVQQELEDKEDEIEEEDLLWSGAAAKKKKRKGKHGKGANDDDDPWAELAKSREGSKQKNLQDVVQAPPQLKKVKSKFKDHSFSAPGVGVDVVNVPSSVGSLRKREEVGARRREIIEGYRKTIGRGTQSRLRRPLTATV